MDLMPFGDARTSENNDNVEWSTDVLQYPFLEGMCRFVLAALGNEPDDVPSVACMPNCAEDNKAVRTSHGNPRSYLPVLPKWYEEYVQSNQKIDRQKISKEKNDMLQKRRQEDQEHFGSLLRDESLGPLQFESAKAMEEYLEPLGYLEMKLDCNYLVKGDVVGLTMFGPLCLGDLMGKKRCGDSGRKLDFDSWFSRERDGDDVDALFVGYGRVGNAYRKTVRGCDLVCKQLLCGSLLHEEKEQMLDELHHEMCIYHALLKLQGKLIPRFVYAGSLVNAEKWVCPERGEMYGLATTWAGASFATKDGVKNGKKMVKQKGKGIVLAEAKAALKAIHDEGVLHGDIERRNIVCDGRRIMFVDFGHATLQKEVSDVEWERLRREEWKDLKHIMAGL